MPDLAGECEGCQRTFERLDTLIEAAANLEVELTHIDKRAARLHALAAVESWWLDRMLKAFPNRATAIESANLCLVNVFREQGIDIT